jgi:mono/diheme cytochrome c family protein
MALAGFALFQASDPSWAQPANRGEDGRRLATMLCSSCHVIGPTAPGPSMDAVPTFVSVARKPSTTAMSLRVFLQTPHANMPDIQLSRGELDAIVDYILSLAPR